MTRMAKLAAMVVAALAAFAPVAAKANPFKDIRIDGTATKGAVQGTLDIDGFFQQDGQLWASGVFTGTIGEVQVSTAARAPMTGGTDATAVPGPSVGPTCWFLRLDTGVIYFDLLETRVDTQPIEIVLDAHQTPDYRIANLLCAAGGLLDEIAR